MDDRQVTGSSDTAGRNRHPRIYVSQGEYSPMLKPLTLSLSLAVALGLSSVSMAGGHDGCSTCGLASPQGGPIASARCLRHRLRERDSTAQVPSLQRDGQSPQRPALQAEGNVQPPVCYEWVLKKKRMWGHHGGGCGGGGCDTCGGHGLSDRPGCSVGPGRLCGSVGPGRLCGSSGCSGLRRWPARLQRREACSDHRLGSCRDDPGRRG